MNTRFLFAFAALLSVTGAAPALAADLPTKAPAGLPTVTCTATTCSGWYIGGQIEGAGPIATGQADLTNGVGLGGHVGYQLWNGSWFAAAELGVTGYVGQSTFIANNSTVSPGVWSADAVAKLGYGLSGFFSTGSATTPSQGLFANLNANLLSPYALVGTRCRQFGCGLESGAGIEYAIGNGWNVDVEYLHVNYNGSENGISIGTENGVKVGINRMF